MTPVTLYSQDQSADSLEYSPRGALLRSAVIPGWGQMYTRHYLKGVGFFAVHAYFGYRFYEGHQQLAGVNDLQRREQLEYRRNTWAWRFLVAYLLCLTDAYVDAHLSGFPDDTGDLSIDVLPEVDGMRIQMEFTW